MKLIQAEHVHRSTEHPHCNSFSTVNGMQPVAQGDRARPEPFELSYWTAFGTNSAAKSPTIGSRWPSRRRARTRKHGRGKFFCFSQRAPTTAPITAAAQPRAKGGRRPKRSRDDPSGSAEPATNTLYPPRPLPREGGATRRGRLPRWASKYAPAPPPRPPSVLMEADLSPLIRWGSSKRTPPPSADSHMEHPRPPILQRVSCLRPCGVELRLRHRQPLAGGG